MSCGFQTWQVDHWSVPQLSEDELVTSKSSSLLTTRSPIAKLGGVGDEPSASTVETPLPSTSSPKVQFTEDMCPSMALPVGRSTSLSSAIDASSLDTEAASKSSETTFIAQSTERFPVPC